MTVVVMGNPMSAYNYIYTTVSSDSLIWLVEGRSKIAIISYNNTVMCHCAYPSARLCSPHTIPLPNSKELLQQC